MDYIIDLLTNVLALSASLLPDRASIRYRKAMYGQVYFFLAMHSVVYTGYWTWTRQNGNTHKTIYTANLRGKNQSESINIAQYLLRRVCPSQILHIRS